MNEEHSRKFSVTSVSELEAGTVKFLKSLNKEHPGYMFSLTPSIYNPDTLEVLRGIMVRLPNGSLKKLRAEWNVEQIQDAEVLNNPHVAEARESSMLENIRSSIGEEMKLL